VTHDVINQATILEDFNLFLSNRRLQESLETFGVTAEHPTIQHLTSYGAYCGSSQAMQDAFMANHATPVFTPFDRQGRRIDNATFHESYHRLMSTAMTAGVSNFAYQPDAATNGGQVSRVALSYMHYQLEQATSCPLTMTYACVPVLEQANRGGVFDEFLKKLKNRSYDPRDIHVSLKTSAMCGMSMTEKQGGSDVRSNTTTAQLADKSSAATAGAPGTAYVIRGHKWFTSAPMCDAFLTLAQTGPKGELSCFLIPRWLSPEQRNTGLRFQRLKNKLGDKANASSEVEYHDAIGFLVGTLGHGVRTIIEMVNFTRLDCLLGSAALVQAATYHAVAHTSTRTAFGSRLIEKPLMQNVLCDLALESEASTALGFRLAHAFNQPNGQNETEENFRRGAVAIGKYFACKRAPALVYEALECLGGNGYVEDFPMARYFRQSPLNAIWEGSGNVIVLDVFRALLKEPKILEAIRLEVAATNNPILKQHMDRIASVLVAAVKSPAALSSLESQGRVVVETIAKLLQAAALHRTTRNAEGERVYDAFVKARFGERPCASLLVGTLPNECVSKELLLRHQPVVA